MTVWILLCHLCLHLCVLVCCCDAILVLVGVILPGVLVVSFVDCLNGGGTIGGTGGCVFCGIWTSFLVSLLSSW